eukprot:592970-Amorphochlora_amoeboformis.AAC.1
MESQREKVTPVSTGCKRILTANDPRGISKYFQKGQSSSSEPVPLTPNDRRHDLPLPLDDAWDIPNGKFVEKMK